MNLISKSVKSFHLWKSVIQTMKKEFEEQIKEEERLNIEIFSNLSKIQIEGSSK